MRVRAGASNGEMLEALGVDVRRLFSVLFSIGTALAALAGMLAAPLTTVFPGMGESVLVVSFVVVVIGGIGSIKGAFAGAMLVGIADTFGKVLLPSISSAIVYAVMAAVLIKISVKLILLPFKLILFPFLAVFCIVKMALLLAAGVIAFAILIPVLIVLALFATPFLIASALV